MSPPSWPHCSKIIFVKTLSPNKFMLWNTEVRKDFNICILGQHNSTHNSHHIVKLECVRWKTVSQKFWAWESNLWLPEKWNACLTEARYIKYKWVEYNVSKWYIIVSINFLLHVAKTLEYFCESDKVLLIECNYSYT